MWLERLFIVFTSTAHDFLPNNWGGYIPSWVEINITLASAAFFFFWFFCFSKTLPTVPLSELKGRIADEEIEVTGECRTRARQRIDGSTPAVLAVFSNAGRLVKAVKAACDAGFSDIETFTPVKIDAVDKVLGRPKSPVRFWTLIGALAGLGGGLWLAIGTALVNNIIVGGKPPVAIIPYSVIAFEGTILLGSIANLVGLILNARLYRLNVGPFYDRRFSRDKFGLLISCGEKNLQSLRELLSGASAEEVHVHY